MDLIKVKDLTFQNSTKNMWSKSETTFDLGPVSFNFKEGETLAIVGNNSSGKSLLAKLLVGLETPKSGGHVGFNTSFYKNKNLWSEHRIYEFIQNIIS